MLKSLVLYSFDNIEFLNNLTKYTWRIPIEDPAGSIILYSEVGSNQYPRCDELGIVLQALTEH